MLLKKCSRVFWAMFLLLTVLSVNVCAADTDELDFSRKGSVSVTMRESGSETVISSGVLVLYQVAEIKENDGNLSYELTPEFEESNVDLADVNAKGLAKTLEIFAADRELQGEEKPVTESGIVCFRNLNSGLYLVMQTKASEGYYPAESFLVSVPMQSEDGMEWIYDVDATPKMELKPDTPEKPIDLTVKKVWEDDGKNRPDSISVGLYDGDVLVEKVVLNAGCNWTHTWKGLDSHKEWKILEINVPKGYTVSYQTTNFVTTVTNTGKLIQTGQLNWPVPVMVFSGLLLMLIGYVLLHSKRKS